MMHMTFYWGKDATILFDGWKTSTWPGYGASLLALFFSSVFYQYLTAIARSSAPFKPSSSSIEEPLISSTPTKILRRPAIAKILSSAFFGFRVGVGYLLMLAVMSFNSGIFIAVVLGFAVGYYLVGELYPPPPPSSVAASLEDVDLCCS